MSGRHPVPERGKPAAVPRDVSGRWPIITGMRRHRIGMLIFGAATLVGLYFALQAVTNPDVRPPLRWSQALGINLTFYYLWALTTPLVVVMARRFRFESGRWLISLAAHLGISMLATAVEIAIGEGILTLLSIRAPDLAGNVRTSFIVNFQTSLPTYWLILFVYLTFDYYAKYRDREVRAAQLAAQLSHAQLQALKMQLKPHFLFNTLNSISSLMYREVDAADAMLARLSEFLRLTLDRDLDHEVSLEEELRYVLSYLEIEKIRFEDRLRITVEVEAGSERGLVPTLALQPLVENAIRHGIAPRARGGSIAIRARRSDENLHLTVSDDGIGQATEGVREHVGLANTRARLQHLYGDGHRFSFSDCDGGGFVVDIVIPFRTGAVLS